MSRNLGIMLSVLLVIIINALAFAQNHSKLKTLFNVSNANKQLAVISGKLPSLEDLPNLTASAHQLESLRDRAKKCVERAELELKTITDLMSITQIDQKIPTERSDYQYFKDKKLFYTNELSRCRLFVYRSQEMLIDYKDKIQKLSTYAILSRGNLPWKISLESLSSGLQAVNFHQFINEMGFSYLTMNRIITGFFSLSIGFLFAVYMKALCQQWLQKERDSHISIYAFFLILRDLVIPLFLFGIISSFLNFIFTEYVTKPFLELASHAILIYALFYALSRYLFYPSQSITGFFKLQSYFGQKTHRRFITLITGLLIGYLCYTALENQSINTLTFEFFRALFVTLIGIFSLWFLLPWLRYYQQDKKYVLFFSFFRFVLWVSFFILIALEWTGYHHLVLYVVTGVLLTVLYTVLISLIWHWIDIGYERIDDRRYRFAQVIYQFFGVRSNRRLYEFSLIRFSIYFFLLCWYVISVMYVWRISENWIDTLIGWLFSGFNAAGVLLIPAHLAFALIVFSIILLIGRFIATEIAKQKNFQGESDTQIAISTIIVYISFSIAFLFALLVTGINFTNLAIIAGALSVGIGLGLQNIVNNFVSGLILLIEKPIKPGDRIVVGDTEGFVKRIRIRSTQIATMSKEDVIVPNADLITHKVTNYMFRDRFWRIVCSVGVSYGSDVELVKKVLLDVARLSNDVVHDIPNDPVVLFRKFGQNSLDFELWCVIYDVNKKYSVASELNFSINAAFRKNNITIAYPQCDVHIKKD